MLVALAACDAEEAEPASDATGITASTTGAGGDSTSGSAPPASTSTSSGPVSTASTGGDADGSSGGPSNPSFDLGMPDVPEVRPPDYGTTPLEQVWYLTNGVDSDILIDFNVAPPLVTCEGVIGTSSGIEGTAVFTRPDTGALLFYTDGNTVLNGQSHNPVANGTGLNGNSSCTEAALITPSPADEDVFYIFTNPTSAAADSSLYYSVIDLSQGPDGTVTVANELLTTGNPGEALDALPHGNGSDFWVLSYDGAASISAFLVDANGVSPEPVVSATGWTGAVYRASINHSEDYGRVLLSAGQGGDCGFIATADFDAETGAVSNFVRHVDDCLGTGYQASFSPDATKIYYTQGAQGYSGTPWQYDLVTGVATQLSTTSGFGASKLAPDDRVYFVGVDKTSLAVVTQPNASGPLAAYVEDGLPLQGCTSGYAVPNQTSAFLAFLGPEG